MIVRLYNPDDLKNVETIHAKHHAKDFDIKDYHDAKVLERIVITDAYGDIITTGMVKTMLEVVAITDMDRNVRERREALLKLLDSVRFIAKTYDYDSLHCFPLTGEVWTEQLKEYGFAPTKGICLSIGVE